MAKENNTNVEKSFLEISLSKFKQPEVSMKRLKIYAILFCSICIFSAFRNGNKQVEGNNYNWIQCNGTQNFSVSGIVASGNNLIAGAFLLPTYPYGFILLSTNGGESWKVIDSLAVNNTNPGIPTLFYGCTLTFIADSLNLFAGVGEAFTGNIYKSTDNGLNWSDKGIIWN
jgi:photosystem II stability/assembly factor-like uncharacterized protein